LHVVTKDGIVGIEVSELLPLPRNESLHSTLAEADRHESSVRLAERIYYAHHDAIPVKVTAYPWGIERASKKRDVADSLASFVKLHCHRANPVATFARIDEVPEGFGVISICSTPGSWWSGQSVVITLDGIRRQLRDRIEAKNKLLPIYRSNLSNTPIWLLLYSCWEVVRGVPMPHGIGEWSFPFGFDRVFFFSTLSNSVEEIRRTE
jgi:hypothetical protein